MQKYAKMLTFTLYATFCLRDPFDWPFYPSLNPFFFVLIFMGAFPGDLFCVPTNVTE